MSDSQEKASSHTESKSPHIGSTVSFHNIEFSIDRDNELEISTEARDGSNVNRWLTRSEGQELLRLLQLWLSHPSDEEHSK
jgi:hypothetical protein